MLATILIQDVTCVYDGERWDCEPAWLKAHLNAYTQHLFHQGIRPEQGDRLLAVVHEVMAVFGGQPVTLPPPAASSGDPE